MLALNWVGDSLDGNGARVRGEERPRVYRESKVFGEFPIDCGALGPTEVRLVLILLNTLAFWSVATGRATPVDIAPGATVVVYAGLGIMSLLLLRRFAGNLRRPGRGDPPRPG